MAQAVDITNLLHGSQNPDHAIRTQSEQALQEFGANNPSGFFVSLSTELASADKPDETRKLAGIILKNQLDAKDEARKGELCARWVALDGNLKSQIKTQLLQSLGTTKIAGGAAAQVIAKIAAIELPRQEWPELIGALLGNMQQQGSSSVLKQSTLDALGYVCEEMANITEDIMDQESVNNVLTAVVQGMRQEEGDNAVRLAATCALCNALEFAETNFEKQDERDYIMKVVCEGCICSDAEVRTKSFECLVAIAADYYEKLPSYITAIYQLCEKAIKEDTENVALQAVEFWNTVAEYEAELQAEEDEAPSSAVNHHFCKQALSALVPLLLTQLVKQEEGTEGDDSVWDIAVASGACITLLAACCGNDILQHIMPFVQANISKMGSPEDWRWREAATTAFGAILDGPSDDQLYPMVENGLSYLIQATKDENSYVRHTTLWCIGQIFLYLQGVDGGTALLTNNNTMQTVVEVLKNALADQPSIATRSCLAICELAACFEDVPESPLTPYFQDIVTLLMTTADRPAVDNTNLAMSAYEAINDMVRYSSGDTIMILGDLMQVMMQKLQSSVVTVNSADHAEKLHQLQGCLCGVLQVIIQKLATVEEQSSSIPAATVLQRADQLMQTFITLFHSRNAVFDEALLAVGALTVPCGKSFSKYMQTFYPILESGLKNFEDWQVCIASVGLVGDIARAIGEEIMPYCGGIMQILWSHLVNTQVHRNVKPQILSVFGDIALQIGDHFEPYMADTFTILNSAAQMAGELPTAVDDMADYNSQLRQGILEAYTGIFQGMSSEKINSWLQSSAQQGGLVQVAFILEFVERVTADVDASDEGVIKAAVGLLGDVASTVPSSGQVFKGKPFYISLVQKAMQSRDGSLASTAQWAGTAIHNAIAQTG
mmetsp:Transcript_27625/g.65566  ORF Transcript_27625/g.65566 Transcript_27625/m.65566 type:complete len:891 (-) Transcript_27625:1094-3766(-)|eukprot:CAMPEP_0177608760 /NCGR_PEP_ID=MMETSP0419_2-20121207/18659_1 /TAXON_ID=582737 /ORGANISM="Tetraselmis sp., Strain GSL018" /LENGTH=890 /DNA_ID=CAMNT_0019103503 /DNA_START=44 /DNA_END=2716 /DNA_ORIENTATION=-